MKFWKSMLSVIGLLAIVSIFLTACSNNSGSNSGNSDSNTTKVSKGSKNNKTLILYFSLTGTTKGAAQYIQKQTGADLIRLEPVKRYKGYDDASKRGNRELRNNLHPALATKIPNFSKYNTVLIGYPTWWARPPMLIHTLFDKYNFKGKTVIPFTTSMSTPISQSEPTIKAMAQKQGATFKNGIKYDDNNAQTRAWLRKLGLLK